MHQPYPGSPEQYAQRKPETPAFFEGDRIVTWKEYDELANVLARHFRDLGVGQGSRIATRLGIGPEWFIIHHAASKLGASLVGINARATLHEVEYLLTDSAATCLVLDDEEPGALIELAGTLGLRAVVPLEPAEPAQGPSYSDIITATSTAEAITAAAPAQLILYTSGTTGRPKGVALDPRVLMSRQHVMAYRDYLAKLVPVDELSKFLLNMPLHHGAGPNSALFCLRAGGSVILQRRFDAAQALQLIERHRATNWMAVPTMIHRLRTLPEALLNGHDVSSMRSLNIGAAAVSVELKRWASGYFGRQCLIFEGYGMSETQMISYLLPEHWDEAGDSSGKPMPYVDVKIIGRDGHALGPGEKGEICARTPVMIDRYLNRPPLDHHDLTADGYFRTGDVGHLDERGYLYVTDRLKDMIIVGGANVYPAEVEAVLNTHPAVIEAAVIGIPDDDLGEQILAYCELKPGAEAAQQTLIDFCRERLAPHKTPRRVEPIEQLPRNATGKVIKFALREPFWRGRQKPI